MNILRSPAGRLQLSSEIVLELRRLPTPHNRRSLDRCSVDLPGLRFPLGRKLLRIGERARGRGSERGLACLGQGRGGTECKQDRNEFAHGQSVSSEGGR